MEATVYIIKPEAMLFREQIINTIEQIGLEVVERKTTILPQWMLDELYPELPDDLRFATRKAFDSIVEIGVICGECAIERFLDFAGRETDPSQCDIESLRFRFGKLKPVLIGSVSYFANAIHRSKNQMEAKRDLQLFKKL